jgi:hypothetical protein
VLARRHRRRGEAIDTHTSELHLDRERLDASTTLRMPPSVMKRIATAEVRPSHANFSESHLVLSLPSSVYA